MDVESLGSWPAMALSTMAQSATSLVMGPIWSSELAKAMRPKRLTAPYVGFMPTTPHSAAGCRMLPPVSEPSEKTHSFAATAAVGPPLLPPGTRLGVPRIARGEQRRVLGGRPHGELVQVALAQQAPSAGVVQARCVTVASNGGTNPSSIRDEQVVATPRVDMLSLSCIGMPVSGPASPAAMRSSARAACARAKSAVTVTKALGRCRPRRRSAPGGPRPARPTTPRGCPAARAPPVSSARSAC